MKKAKFVTASSIARAAKLTPQSIASAEQRGKLQKHPGTSLFDLNDPTNSEWLAAHKLAPGDVKCRPLPGGVPTAPAATKGRARSEIQKELDEEKLYAQRLKNAVLEKSLVSVDFLEDKVFRYLGKLHSNLERAAGVGIDEIGPKIIEAGEVLPCHIEEFVNVVCKIIHETKLGIVREIKAYDPSKGRGKK